MPKVFVPIFGRLFRKKNLFLFVFLILTSCESVPLQNITPTAEMKTSTMSPTSLPLPTISEPTQTATPFPSPTPRPPIYSTVHPAPNSISMELFGNFHAMGVTVALPTNNDPDKNALAFLEKETMTVNSKQDSHSHELMTRILLVVYFGYNQIITMK